MPIMGIDVKGVAHYILIYLFLIFHGATIYVLNSSILELLIEFVCIFLWVTNSRIRKKSVLLLLFILLFLTVIVSAATGSGTGFNFFRIVADQILITYVVVLYDKKFFLKRFLKILSIFAVVSIIYYVISIIDPNILFRLLTARIENINNIHYVSIFYSVHQAFGRPDLRNSGIYTEPGIYAVILNSAVYALLFFNNYLKVNSKQRYLYFLIFSLAILTTLSTIAYVVWGIIVIGYIFEIKIDNQLYKEKRILVVLCLIFVVILAFNYFKQGENSILSTYVLSKASNTALQTEESSGNARAITIETCLSIIAKYPFGAGGYLVTASLPSYAVAAAFLIYTAAMGLVNAGVLYLYFLIPAFKNKTSLMAFVIFILMYIMLSLAQSQVWYPSLLIFPVMWQSFEKVEKVTE